MSDYPDPHAGDELAYREAWEGRLDRSSELGDDLEADETEQRAIEGLRARRPEQIPDEETQGITAEGLELGHRYVMGNVNAYCPKCSAEQGVTVLDCDYDLDK